MECREPSAFLRLFKRFVNSLRALTECSSSLPFTPFSFSCTHTGAEGSLSRKHKSLQVSAHGTEDIRL